MVNKQTAHKQKAQTDEQNKTPNAGQDDHYAPLPTELLEAGKYYEDVLTGTRTRVLIVSKHEEEISRSRLGTLYQKVVIGRYFNPVAGTFVDFEVVDNQLRRMRTDGQ